MLASRWAAPGATTIAFSVSALSPSGSWTVPTIPMSIIAREPPSGLEPSDAWTGIRSPGSSFL